MKIIYSLVAFILTFTHVANAQHTLKKFTGKSDFGSADVTIQEGAVKAVLKTRGILSFDNASTTITLDNFSASCSKNVVFDNSIIHIKGKVIIKTMQLTIKRDCQIEFVDNDAVLTIEYEEMDAVSSSKKLTITKLHSGSLILKKTESICD